jgi:predicted transcriptional regulator
MKQQVVLDAGTAALLDSHARSSGNDRSAVLREALRVYAVMENRLDALERGVTFHASMESALDDVAAGRVRPHADARRVVRRKGRTS